MSKPKFVNFHIESNRATSRIPRKNRQHTHTQSTSSMSASQIRIAFLTRITHALGSWIDVEWLEQRQPLRKYDGARGKETERDRESWCMREQVLFQFSSRIFILRRRTAYSLRKRIPRFAKQK